LAGDAIAQALESESAAISRGETYTYPMFLPLWGTDDLALLFRRGGPWDGEIRVQRWREQQSKFESDAVPLISGTSTTQTAGPYLNRPVRLVDGRVALFHVWRLAPTATSAGDVVNTGMDLVLADPQVQTLQTYDGILLKRPVRPVNSPRIVAVNLGSNLINQAGASSGADGSPMAVSYWNDRNAVPQYHLIWRQGGGWRATPLTGFRTKFALQGRGTLPLPHSRPELLVSAEGVALCVFRSQEYGNRLMVTLNAPPYDEASRRRTLTLLDEDLGHYEPIVNHEAYQRTGDLTLYVQWCHQGLGDCERGDKLAAPARLLRWSAEQIASWSPVW
jgi:hypothetical protein